MPSMFAVRAGAGPCVDVRHCWVVRAGRGVVTAGCTVAAVCGVTIGCGVSLLVACCVLCRVLPAALLNTISGRVGSGQPNSYRAKKYKKTCYSAIP